MLIEIQEYKALTDLSLGLGVLRTLSSSSSSGPLSLGFSNSTLSRSSSTSRGGSAGSCSESKTYTHTCARVLSSSEADGPPVGYRNTHLVRDSEALEERHHALLEVLLLKDEDEAASGESVGFHLDSASQGLTLVMDGVRTIDLLCFFGFLTSYSSSSRS